MGRGKREQTSKMLSKIEQQPQEREILRIRRYEMVRRIVRRFLSISIFVVQTLYGIDIKEMEVRPYVRNNTWNGCCVFNNGSKTLFQVRNSSKDERVIAACLAIHHVRYGRNVRIPVSYYEREIPLTESDKASNVVRKVELNLEQFAPPIGDNVVINDVVLDEMKIRVLPFKVKNTKSKADLRCVLVGFFHDDAFCLAVYVNMNNGKVSLDFHDVDDYMLLANESRYPYLKPRECDVQANVYVKYFKQEEPPRNLMSPCPQRAIIPPGMSTNDLEVLIDL